MPGGGHGIAPASVTILQDVPLGSEPKGKDRLEACVETSRLEGIIPALESSHALAFCKRQLAETPDGAPLIIINLSGRGDKDMAGLENMDGTGMPS